MRVRDYYPDLDLSLRYYININYRVTKVVGDGDGDMGWVGLTVILVLPLSSRFWQGRWGFGRVIGQDGGISQIEVNPTHVPNHFWHPVSLH